MIFTSTNPVEVEHGTTLMISNSQKFWPVLEGGFRRILTVTHPPRIEGRWPFDRDPAQFVTVRPKAVYLLDLLDLNQDLTVTSTSTTDINWPISPAVAYHPPLTLRQVAMGAQAWCALWRDLSRKAASTDWLRTSSKTRACGWLNMVEDGGMYTKYG